MKRCSTGCAITKFTNFEAFPWKTIGSHSRSMEIPNKCRKYVEYVLVRKPLHLFIVTLFISLRQVNDAATLFN